MTGLESVSAAWGGFAGELVLRATLVLAGALVLALVLRRGSAGARHVLWSMTLTGLLALPLLSGLAPSVPVAVPWIGERGAALVGAPFTAEPVAVELPRGSASEGVPDPSIGFQSEAGATAAGMPPSPVPVSGAREGTSAPPSFAPASAFAPSSAELLRHLPSGLFLLWFAGAAVLLGLLLVGLRCAVRLIRDAEPVTDEGWLESLGRLPVWLPVT